ncbi:phage portal protein [Altererythrobacter aurantiacus]|uniref:Phage portal protein n=1 Tax=Parapontixanthobacter aurantiacus TaxID=1463599 RepID=A0A844ZCA0_9SPHN|nr:phage portal protein [Parapontixanthobacter aurantiacus]MXO86181.1 phage portal protein [Parapontixanthobacter aurantiacus]
MSFLNALAAAFKGGGGTALPLAPRHAAPYAASFASGQEAFAYDYEGAVKAAYIENPVAQRAVRIVAEAAGDAPLKLEEPRVASLLKNQTSGQSLLETLAAHLLLNGNAFIQIVKDASGAPVDLFALRPERVTVLPAADGWPRAYRYRIGAADSEIPVEDADGWPNLIHLRGLHPTDDHYGAGCLTAAAQSVALHNTASAWNRALLANAARPSGALVYDTGEAAGLSAEQFDRLKAELTEAFAGQANAGRPMLLEGGLTWQSMSMSPADMDFAALKAAAARDIALAFGVPPMLLGLPGDNTYSNYREANRALWRLTLLPLIGKITEGLVSGLSPWFPDLSIGVDLDRIPALSEDRERLWSQVSEADFLDPDEKRAMLGLPPRAESNKETSR